MRLSLLVIIGFCHQAFCLHTVQSEFEGPVGLNVWAHSQDSWNVERDAKFARLFRLTRGRDGAGAATVVLDFNTAKPGDVASLRCEGIKRSGQWEMEFYQGDQARAEARTEKSRHYFVFENRDDCVDTDGKRIVGKIHFEIIRGGKSLFPYAVSPMFVRGSGQSYWDNDVPGYAAHAGEGGLKVATSLDFKKGKDFWDGVVVKPVLEFVERNTIGKDSKIGLHRHEQNQEMYLVEKGLLSMRNGVAPVVGDKQSVERLWDKATGETRNVDQIRAEGGWIETRNLFPGQLVVIVPNPENRRSVYFHGADAMAETVFWTLGTKN